MAREKIAVIGAGLVGSLQSIYLANRGFEVHVFERRGDIRKVELVGGRSINLALSNRGWKALDGAGMGEKIRSICIPMPGRMMHSIDGELTFQPYGKDGEAIYSVPRGELNQLLLAKADENEHVELHFDVKCKDINLRTNEIQFENALTRERSTHQFDHIIGTDGAFSAVRLRLQKTDRFNFSQTSLTHGYKELVIPPTAGGGHRIEKSALHIWPRGEYMLIALPNQDGSFTVTLFFPFEGDPSFESLDTDEKIMGFFQEQFPDALEHMPNLIEDYHDNPTSSLVTVRCSPWHYEDKVCIMG
ncbi:MAG: NAD(P)/FAD-dependent oxidoreductase, partial [Myxococcota bacterium]